MEIELARINVVEHRNDHKEPDVPVKVKFQSYDHKSKDDILTYVYWLSSLLHPLSSLVAPLLQYLES
jgi:hypothetical protein